MCDHLRCGHWPDGAELQTENVAVLRRAEFLLSLFLCVCVFVNMCLVAGGSSQLTIHEEQDGSMYIQGARIEPVGCVEDMMDLMREGAANRVVASTS